VDSQDVTGGRLDLLAGSFSCLKLEEDPRILDECSMSHLVLSKAMEHLRNRYDYILFDCPPAWSILTRNALRASQHVLIPYTPDYLALEGILWMRELHAEFAERVGPGNVARLTGIIINRVRTAAANSYVNAHVVALNELGAIIDRIQQKYGHRLHVFQPYIAESAAVTEAVNFQSTLLGSDAHHPVTRQFVGLTSDIVSFLRRIESKPTAYLERIPA
jgi:chromosome partitioning protein